MCSHRMRNLGRWALIALIGLGSLLPAAAVRADQAAALPFDPSQMGRPGDEADLFLYSVFVSGNHSADTGATAGAMAVQGDALIPKVAVNGQAGNFNYAAGFTPGVPIVGDPLTARHKIALLLAGQIRNYSDSGWARVSGTMTPAPNPGWLVTAAAAPYWFTQPRIELQGGARLMPAGALAETFAKLTEQETALTKQLAAYADHPAAGPGIPGGDANLPYTVQPSAADPHVYVVTIAPDHTGTAFMPQVSHLDALIDDSLTKEIIFTTKATKVVFNQQGQYGGSTAIVPQVAHRTLFYLPNATQVTNFTSQNGAAPDINVGRPGLNAVRPVGPNGADLYDKDYFAQMRHHGIAVAGSVVAPQATVVWYGGDMNGYVFSRGLHQRAGAAVHNFYNQWLTARDLTLTKIWADDHNAAGKRPRTVAFNIIADQPAAGTVVQTATLKVAPQAPSQKLTITDLPRFTQDGTPIHYRAEEITPPGYTSSVAADGVTITNTLTPMTQFRVQKHWWDYGEQPAAGPARPTSVAVQLYRGDPAHPEAATKIGPPVTLTAAGAWQHVWQDLPKLPAAQPARYFTREITVPAGYTAAASDTATGTQLTNTYRPSKWHLRLHKTAAGTNAPLAGAEFRVNTQLDGGQVPAAGGQTATTDAAGNLMFSQPLAFTQDATYYLQESKAPAGYQRDAKVIKLTITAADFAGVKTPVTNGNGTVRYSVTMTAGDQAPVQRPLAPAGATPDTLTLTFTNRPQTVLPHTGGTGAGFGLRAAAGALLTAGLLLGLLAWRKEVRQRG
ncbi:Cna B-type domain-containing protein [Lacticaseibacillus jixianensis]|uniref:Cna B-type domain-containing protein n=1 Tax=Lacticaseibacillus jixianensis TaxID=2486012 RepID=A0ABW4BAH9_9LACO|nr:Cna B-type domain-containing protein [Lacticaseibacillus jixianensis]